MKCPECGNEMKRSDFIIATMPATYEYFCEKCNAVWDQCGDNKLHECSSSPRKKEVKNE
jgi:Zn-finger nucleic acid-binding protein